MNPTVYLIQTPPFWLKTPPLGIIYLKNYLAAKGIECAVNDLNKELFRVSKCSIPEWLTLDRSREETLFSTVERSYPRILRDLYRKIEPADHIGLSIFKRNYPFARALAEKILERFPSKKIIFGGPETFFLEQRQALDTRFSWVIGEGEIPLHAISSGNNTAIERFREVPDLDALPFIDLDPLERAQYANAIPLLSSRGCPHTCNFCSEKLLYRKFRYHSPAYMVEQIKYLMQKYDVHTFIFCDSLINYRSRWLHDFCAKIMDEKLTIQWEAQIRVDNTLTSELCGLMKKSGCYNLFVGLESACDKTLRAMRKGFGNAAALEFFKKLTGAGLHFEVSLIFGYPGETHEDFMETLRFIKKNKKIIPKIAQANPYIDYLDDFPGRTFPSEEGKKRTALFLSMLSEEKIKHTRSYIGNLAYR